LFFFSPTHGMNKYEPPFYNAEAPKVLLRKAFVDDTICIYTTSANATRVEPSRSPSTSIVIMPPTSF